MLSAILEAYVVGDAMGMPTEFMTREAIKAKFGPLIDYLIDPKDSQNHRNLPYASVTDDTQQVCYLLRQYQKSGRVDMMETAETLQRWILETDAIGQKTIGPSSLKALEMIKFGTPPEEAGLYGTTCGGMMRTPAAVLFRDRETWDGLDGDIFRCIAPTHNTSTALEAAGAYGYALFAAMHGMPLTAIIRAAMRGGETLKQYASFEASAPSCVHRIRLGTELAENATEEALLDTLYALLGTGLPSADVCGAVFAIFAYAREDSWKAIRMGSSVGGDTDTIAALAGALSAAYAGQTNIPDSILQAVLTENRTLLAEIL